MLLNYFIQRVNKSERNSKRTSSISILLTHLSGKFAGLEKELIIEPFNTKHRLWAKFPHKRFKVGSIEVISRPSFSVPFIKPPNMIPNVDEDQMRRELTLKHLGGIKPEAPWIKRCGMGIKFTDEIQETDFNFEPDSNKNEKIEHKNNQSNIEISPDNNKTVKRVLSEQILYRANKSIEETFAIKEHAYAAHEFDNEIDPNKVSIIEDSKIELDYDKKYY